MRRIRLRIALPVTLTLIDLLLLLASIYNGYTSAREGNFAFAWANDGDTPWATFEYYVPKPLAAFDYGTLPVSYLATSLFPKWIESHPFDRLWAGFHLALGMAFWYAAGRFGETRKLWRVGLVFYIVFRTATLPMSLSEGPGNSTLNLAYVVLWSAAAAFAALAAIAVTVRKGRALLAGNRGRFR